MIKWKDGRQGTGYKVLTFFRSAKLKADGHLIKYPQGSYIPSHKDPAPDGFEHLRVNIVFSFRLDGGQLLHHFGPMGYAIKPFKPWAGLTIKHKGKLTGVEIYKITPSKDMHGVGMVREGSRWVLSFGRLKKKAVTG